MLSFRRGSNPYLAAIEEVFHQGYHWCVDQCEYATDVMFKSRDALEDIYPSLVGHAFYDFKCTDVFPFLDVNLMQSFWEKQSPITVNVQKAGGLNSK